MSAVPPGIWDAVDIFWGCHTRTPGMSCATAVRTGYPRAGGVLDQDAWLMWAFEILQNEYLVMGSESQEDKKRASETANLQAKMQQHGPR